MSSRKSQRVQVGKRTFELSNLDKILYPDDGIVKAELVEYYLKLAPTILSHIKGRPLSLVRYPDGIGGEMFFQKNKPDWAPEWLESVRLGSGEEKKEYVIAAEEASLVWLANLACIELHQMHARAPKFDIPDYLVINLDPPDGFPFLKVVELAFDLKPHIESYGYFPFVKTTGRKGLHLVMPIEPKWTFEEVFEAAKAVVQPFVEKNSTRTTLHIQKEHRKGRVLIDIYRIRPGQTTVAAYSVRGLPGAPVSTPLTWDELEQTQKSADWNLHTVPKKVLSTGDPWETMAAFAVELHTHRKKTAAVKKTLKPSGKHKTPEQLETYSKKRSFDKTPEPQPEIISGQGSAFVIHRHHASRLHYDLRLEKDGVLKSWAVPKGLPPRPGVKRLAVATEDHPMEYLNFEGAIPKGEYGGGQMWAFATGKYQITKEKKNGFYFRLNSRELNGEYRIHLMKENQWLLERVDISQIDWLNDPIEPMLADARNEVPKGEDFTFEVKWDGIRALIALDEGTIRIHSRNQMEITAQFPELTVPEAFRVSGALIDGEIVCLDEAGKPIFKEVIHRMQQKGENAIQRAKAKFPAVCYVFDLLYLDGRPVIHEPLTRRRSWLADVVKKDSSFRVSEMVDEGSELFEAAKQLGLEGIMAKRKTSPYLPGKRSDHWLKVKTRQTMDVVIIGYTPGKGDRSQTFGALHVADRTNDGLRYLGKVGTGFDEKLLRSIDAEIRKIKTIAKPIEEKPLDEKVTTWIEPELMCEVQYASFTKDGMLREPVFLRMREDF
jgi:DNA ligase D-like protein (predicted ligase)/DNA ligase D-like protein (predicted polymerase)/DNA ligase D-like protein (predicted 3'-phosphoesterase)